VEGLGLAGAMLVGTILPGSVPLLRKTILLFLSLCFPLTSFSQPTLLCLAAHPDDEDGATLAYYSKLNAFNAYTLFFTRGEGGQNEIGPELYDQLGRLRENECHDAAAILGSKAFFLGFLDFGYSKTAKETFKFWGGKDSVLQRLVYMIRLIRPDVIITNHDTITTTPNRQHGHHQAVGITAYDAFVKAADPDYHPEQLQDGITPWQVKKLFFRVYDSTKIDGIVTIDIQQRDPVTDKTIEDISFEALAKHRTQGMDKLDPANLPLPFRQRRYQLIRSDKDYPFSSSDLFSGIPLNQVKESSVEPHSYPTHYSYSHLSLEDSLHILRSIKVKSGKIGLVKTYDNTLEPILRAFNIAYDTISSSQLAEGSLEYQAILLDLRAYLYRLDLIKHNNKVLDYVYGGGRVICFYNKPGEWNGKNYAPYPIHLTNERVTDENASVKIIGDGIMRSPNKINEHDFDGWIQERSIYLPSSDTNLTSSRYSRILDMDDESEDQPPTSILSADYGKGKYTYISLALYRQLKIFHPGALKLLMNLISQ